MRPGRHRLLFRAGKVTVRGMPARDQAHVADRLLRNWTGGRPIPKRQPLAGLVFLSTLLTIPALLLAWGGSTFQKEAAQDLGPVDPAAMRDAGAVPAGAFVTVSGRPDLSHVGYLSGEDGERRGGVLLVLREAPRLVLYCREDQPLARAVYRYRPDPEVRPKPAALKGLEKVWTIRGRVYEAGDRGGSEITIPTGAVGQFATEDLGLASAQDVRVLAVGLVPDDLLWSARLAYGMAVAVGVPAAFLWLLTLRAAVRARKARSAPEDLAGPGVSAGG